MRRRTKRVYIGHDFIIKAIRNGSGTKVYEIERVIPAGKSFHTSWVATYATRLEAEQQLLMLQLEETC